MLDMWMPRISPFAFSVEVCSGQRSSRRARETKNSTARSR